ncbi:hypothetical protein R5R35_003487 [Gryllus longicercus]|uniref:SAM domain-containing protein n=1 Tax=Gryllus longicercus TaxID=2509291 RepID=A0AAN9VUT4_9ORTH
MALEAASPAHAHAVHHDQVPVDRRRLERMIAGGDENLEPAEVFFKRIMLETGAKIYWPSHLKIGGKSRKTPRVHLAGSLLSVMEAARRVQEGLAASEERVTLKLDLSHAFHSHLIGRGGAAVQRLMQETGAHVHFPDCNRAAAPSAPRSNLVSAAGPLRHVEHARRRLRELMPLVFCLDVAAEAGGDGAAAAAAAQRRFGVSVRARPGGGGGEGGGGGVQLQVRGAQEDLPRMRTACAALSRQLRGDHAPEGLTQVYSWLQMSAYNAGAALGRGGETLRRIAAATGARLLPPEPPAPAAASDAATASGADPATPEAQAVAPAATPRGAVHISGSFDAVFLARQQLLGSLPLKLVFDIPENFPLDGALVVQLMNVLGVSITTFQKEKQHLTTVTIRGTERFATNIYEARRILLGITEAPVIAEIPETYHIPTKPSLLNVPVVGSIPKCYGSDSSSESCPNRSTPDTLSRVSITATGNNGMQGAQEVLLTDSGGKGIHSSWLEMLNSLDFIQNCLKTGNPPPFEMGQRPLSTHGKNFPDMQLMTNPSTGECNTALEHAQNLQNSHFGVDTLLLYMGLQKYIDLFHAEEIDWPVFQTLNEQDLINIGITAYGSRRKILGIIAALKKFQVPFSGSAAPGAERRGPLDMHDTGATPW